jgi:hypothetical protein
MKPFFETDQERLAEIAEELMEAVQIIGGTFRWASTQEEHIFWRSARDKLLDLRHQARREAERQDLAVILERAAITARAAADDVYSKAPWGFFFPGGPTP